MRFLVAALSCALGIPAAAQTVTLKNPHHHAIPDALISLPGSFPKVHSVVSGGHVVPAQYIASEQRLVFTTSLEAGATKTLRLSTQQPPSLPRRVYVTLNVQEGGTLQGDAIKGGVFHEVPQFTPPQSHFIHDGLIAFEGIGWESDRVAYRLYLDQRNVPDFFGKFGPDIIFPGIGHGFDDYQYPRAWGGDIYKVANGLGMGGLGILRQGKASQYGPSRITGKVIAQGPVTAIAGVDADDLQGKDIYLYARYAISAGSALTHVTAKANGLSDPLVAGLTEHATDTKITSPQTGSWRYIALWGPQEHGDDPVGTVVFYRGEDIEGEPQHDGASFFVRFKSRSHVSYAFAGRWVQEGKNVLGYHAVADIEAFKLWLEETREELDCPVESRISKKRIGE